MSGPAGEQLLTVQGVAGQSIRDAALDPHMVLLDDISRLGPQRA